MMIYVGADATLFELKKKIEGLFVDGDLPATKQDVVYSGNRLLYDNRPLKSYGIINNATLIVYQKIRVFIHKGDLEYAINANEAMTVGSLKNLVDEIYHTYCTEHYRLQLIDGQERRDVDHNLSLSDANIVDDSHLVVVFKF